MAILVKVEEVGGQLVVVLPSEVLDRLNIKTGDTLEFLTSAEGLLLKSYDPRFDRQMAAMRHIMTKHRDFLKKLADS